MLSCFDCFGILYIIPFGPPGISPSLASGDLVKFGDDRFRRIPSFELFPQTWLLLRAYLRRGAVMSHVFSFISISPSSLYGYLCIYFIY